MSEWSGRGDGGAGGGDPVCWAHLLCPECGAVPDDPAAATCDRCGEALGDAGTGLAAPQPRP